MFSSTSPRGCLGADFVEGLVTLCSTTTACAYIAPKDFLNGLATQIWAERDRR